MLWLAKCEKSRDLRRNKLWHSEVRTAIDSGTSVFVQAVSQSVSQPSGCHAVLCRYRWQKNLQPVQVKPASAFSGAQEAVSGRSTPGCVKLKMLYPWLSFLQFLARLHTHHLLSHLQSVYSPIKCLGKFGSQDKKPKAYDSRPPCLIAIIWYNISPRK
jgi:hypothetical protein